MQAQGSAEDIQRRYLAQQANPPEVGEEETAMPVDEALLSISDRIDRLLLSYELEKLSAQKERNRHYILFALGGGCLFLLGLLSLRTRRHLWKSDPQALPGSKPASSPPQPTLPASPSAGKPVHPYNPNAARDKLCASIRQLLLEEKIYHDPNLTRDAMIFRLGTNRKRFAAAFQHGCSLAFTDYINTLRLDEAIELLETTELSIEIISERAGFGSVRTFQRQFHTKYNQTPKDYRLELLQTEG